MKTVILNGISFSVRKETYDSYMRYKAYMDSIKHKILPATVYDNAVDQLANFPGATKETARSDLMNAVQSKRLSKKDLWGQK